MTRDLPPESSTPPLRGRHALALVVSSMIGSGIFTTSGLLLGTLHSPWLVLAAWALAGGLALAGAMSYAELGAMMPRAGGEYAYLSRAFHPAVGFLSGFVSLVAGFAAPIAAASLAFGRYLATVVPGIPPGVAAAALIVAATIVNASGTARAARVQTALTALNLLLVVGFAAVLFMMGHRDHAAAAPLPSATPGAFAVSLVYVSYSYLGWNAAAYVAAEIREPRTTLPRVLLGGTGLVTVLYLILNVAFLMTGHASDVAGKVEIAHIVARRSLGPGAAVLTSLLICVALAGHVSGMVMTGPRVYAAMANDGLFFRVFAGRPTGGAPVASVLLQGLLALALALTATFEGLLLYTGLLLCLSTTLTVAGVIVLRRREPAAPRPFRAWPYPWAPVSFLGLSIWMSIHTVIGRPIESVLGLGTLVLGGLGYRWFRKGRGSDGALAR